MAEAKPGPWVQLAALCGVPLAMVLGNAMLMPVLPEMGRELHLPRAAAGLAITAFSLAAGLGIPVAGFLADRLGRKPVVVTALLLFGIGAAASAAGGWWLGERSFPVVLTGRAVQGLGAAGMAYIALAFAGDLFAGNERVSALGILEGSGGMGKVLSPVIGALVGLMIAWWGVFLVQALVAFAAALAVWRLTRDPGHHRRRPVGEYVGSLAKVVRARGAGLFACYGVGFVNHLVITGVLYFLSQHLEIAYGVRGIAKGWQLMWPQLAMSLLSFSSGLYLRRHYPMLKGALLLGLFTVGGGALLMALFPESWLFFAGVLLAGAGTGLQLPALSDLICSSAPSSERAGITSLYGAVRFSGTATGPPLYGWLMESGTALPFWVTAGLIGGTATLALLLINAERLLAGGGGGPGGGGGQERDLPQWQVPAGLPRGTRV